jgi:transcriptional regulator with XRE-family HTH domain
MIERSGRQSRVSMRESTSEGRLGLAAADLALRVRELLRRARDAAALSNTELAHRLEVTDGRVSQVMNGDGNIHIATLARFLRASGYTLQIHAVPAEPDAAPLNDSPTREAYSSTDWHVSTHVMGETDTHMDAVMVPEFDDRHVVMNVKSYAAIVKLPSDTSFVGHSGARERDIVIAHLGVDDWIEDADEAASSESRARLVTR